MSAKNSHFEVLMVGVGPANLSVAAALEDEAPAVAKNTVMLEVNDRIVWQPGLLHNNALSQVSYLKDLATFRDPRSRFTFLSYLHATGRIGDFVNMGNGTPYREEISRYHAWVAGQFRNIRVETSQRVTAVTPIWEKEHITGWRTETESGRSFTSRHVVFGIGREAHVPEQLATLDTNRVIHSTRFTHQVAQFADRDVQRVAIIGAAQSAAEMALESGILFPKAHRTVIMRSIGMVGYETSKFTNELFSPTYVDTFHAFGEIERASILAQMRTSNYAGLAPHTLEALFVQHYQSKLYGRNDLCFMPLTQILDAGLAEDGRVRLKLTSTYEGISEQIFDLVFVGTGFRPGMPALIRRTAEKAGVETIGIDRHYRMDLGMAGAAGAMCFLQGVNEATHGIGDSLLSLQANRAGEIAALIRDTRIAPAAVADRVKPFDVDGLVFENGLRAQRLLPFPIATPFEASWCVIEPGTASTPHAHHEFEIFVALEGEATIEVDGFERRFCRGDTIYFEPGTRHRVVNHSDQDFVMYSIWWDDAMSLRHLAASRTNEQRVSQ